MVAKATSLIFGISCFCSIADAIRAGFGESCDNETRCNSASWLSCQDRICNCTKPEEMIHQEDTNVCAVKAGERCRYAIGEGSHYEFMNCVPGAECHPTSHICVCSAGFYESDEGYCTTRKGNSENCTATKECREGMECLNNSCQCDPEMSTSFEWDEYDYFGGYVKKGYCIGILGQSCIENRCSADTTCFQDPSGATKCTCTDGYYEADGKCYRAFSRSCSTKNLGTCGPGFNCVDVSCRCASPGTQIYDHAESPQCISLVFGSCANSACVRNAECIEVDGYKECRCKEGYTDVDGFCDKEYGSACVEATTAFSYKAFSLEPSGIEGWFNVRCDRNVPLGCINGICNCRDEAKFMTRKSGNASGWWAINVKRKTYALKTQFV